VKGYLSTLPSSEVVQQVSFALQQIEI